MKTLVALRFGVYITHFGVFFARQRRVWWPILVAHYSVELLCLPNLIEISRGVSAEREVEENCRQTHKHA